jgi:hypothetical protein
LQERTGKLITTKKLPQEYVTRWSAVEPAYAARTIKTGTGKKEFVTLERPEWISSQQKATAKVPLSKEVDYGGIHSKDITSKPLRITADFSKVDYGKLVNLADIRPETRFELDVKPTTKLDTRFELDVKPTGKLDTTYNIKPDVRFKLDTDITTKLDTDITTRTDMRFDTDIKTDMKQDTKPDTRPDFKIDIGGWGNIPIMPFSMFPDSGAKAGAAVGTKGSIKGSITSMLEVSTKLFKRK